MTKTLSPEILPTPRADGAGADPRARTRSRMTQLLQLAGTAAVAQACGYGVVDMMPEPVSCADTAGSGWADRLFVADASWDGGNVVVQVAWASITDVAISDEVDVTGGTEVSASVSTSNVLVVTVTPDEGATSVTITGSAACESETDTFTITLDLSGGVGGSIEATVE